MKRYRTSANYVVEEGEVNTLPSLTVPDMAIPLHVLLEKYTRGAQLPQFGEPFYDENYTYPDPRELDLVDLQEMRMDLNSQRDEIERIISQKSQPQSESVQTQSQTAPETGLDTQPAGVPLDD